MFSWCVFIDMHTEEILTYCPKSKINLDCSSFIWLAVDIQQNLVVEPFWKMRKHFLSEKWGSIFLSYLSVWSQSLNAPYLFQTEFYHIPSKLFQNLAWVSDKKQHCESYKKRKQNELFFSISFNVFGRLEIVELGSLLFSLLVSGMFVLTLCDSLFIS